MWTTEIDNRCLRPKLIPSFSMGWVWFVFFLFFSQPLWSFDKSIIAQNQSSMVRVPAKYNYKELAKSLNHHFQVKNNGIMCEDNSYTNNNHDNFKVVCKQLSDIKVSSEDGKVITEVSVRVNAKFFIEYDMKIDLWVIDFERTFSIERPLKFDLYVKFTTSINIDQELKTSANTEWEYDWLSYPYISFGPIGFRVLEQTAPKVDGVIRDYAENKIDKIILEEVDLNNILLDVWSEFEEPILINSDYNLWNFFHLEKVQSGGIFVNKDRLTFPFQIYFNNYAGFGSNLINNNLELWENVVPRGFKFIPLTLTNKYFYLRMPIKLTVKDMERLIFEDISTKDYIFGVGNLKLKLTEVYLSINKNFVTADVYLRGGSENNILGSLVLQITFNPFYDVVQKKLRPRYLTYEILRSDTVLVDIVNATQKQEFSRLLQDTIVLEFNSYVKSIHQLLNEKLKNYPFNEKLIIQSVFDKIDIKNIFIRGKELYVIVDLTGNLEISLRNLF